MITSTEALYKGVNGGSPLSYFSEVLVKNSLKGFAVCIRSEAKELHENCYLNFVKWDGESCIFYIHALCCAEMKQNATYPIAISFATDKAITE